MGVYLEDLTYKEILPILARTGKLIDTRKIIEIDIVRCGECEYADEYNHCKYSAWWNGNADFCSHGIRRKESR